MTSAKRRSSCLQSDKYCLSMLFYTTCSFTPHFDLHQHARLALSRNTRPAAVSANTPGPPLDQLYADLQFEIANLAAQRWLRGVQPQFGGICEAALLSDRRSRGATNSTNGQRLGIPIGGAPLGICSMLKYQICCFGRSGGSRNWFWL